MNSRDLTSPDASWEAWWVASTEPMLTASTNTRIFALLLKVATMKSDER